MHVRVLAVLLLESLRRLPEPLDLVGLDPVVARVLALVGRVGVRVEQVHRQRRVAGRAAPQYLDEVITNTVDALGPGVGQRIGEGLNQVHLGGPRHGAFVVVVAEDGDVRDLVLDEDLGILEDGLDEPC